MALPFEPESVVVARARYAAAVVETLEALEIAAGEAPRPGVDRRHVFDFADGIRLIVSREQVEDGRIFVHVSASPEQSLYRSAVPRGSVGLERLAFAEFLGRASHRFEAISGIPSRRLSLVKVSAAGVPHFVVKEEGA